MTSKNLHRKPMTAAAIREAARKCSEAEPDENAAPPVEHDEAVPVDKEDWAIDEDEMESDDENEQDGWDEYKPDDIVFPPDYLAILCTRLLTASNRKTRCACGCELEHLADHRI